MMKWHIHTFLELSNVALYNILKARVDVFVVEQTCPYPELDNHDLNAIHYYATNNGEVAANVRILPKGVKYEEASIGRVLVVNKYRRQGLARELFQRAMDYTRYELKERKIRLQAQVYLEQFYQSFGFKRISEPYLEDGIPHVDLLWEEITE